MTKEQLIELGLSEEQAVKVSELYSEKLKSFKPAEDFNALETQLKTIEGYIKTLVKDSKGSTLEEQINAFQKAVETDKADLENQLLETKFNHSLEKALNDFKAKNHKSVRALLDLENTKLNEDGSIAGLNEQLKAIKESDAFLFGDEDTAKSAGSLGNWARKEVKDNTGTIGERLGKQVIQDVPESPYFV